jgi:hypothetical protein
MTPPPTTTMRPGIDGSASSVSLSTTIWPSNGTFSGRTGCEPVAIRITSAVIRCTSSRKRETSTVCASMIFAWPCTVTTLCFARLSSTSFHADSTTARSRNMKSLMVMSDFTRYSTP